MATTTQSYAATSSAAPIPTKPTLNGRKSSLEDVARTKILLLGLRRAGKTSIQQVLFNNLQPKETFYLESTTRVTKHNFDSIIPLEIWDCPGNITPDNLSAPLSQFSTMIFVIDIRDLYNQPIAKLVDFIVAAYQQNQGIGIEVFVHKAEKMQEDDKIENFKQINERVSDRLEQQGTEYEQIALNFHLTSVYDHTLHEAFSKVLHRMIDPLPYLEDLLNVFCMNSQSPKAFLFDTGSRLYVATDASPVDSATFNLCCDYLKTLNSLGPLYKSAVASSRKPSSSIPPAPAPLALSPMSRQPSSASGTSLPITRRPSRDLFYPSASISLHPATPGTTLTYHLITPQLALLALLPTSVFEGRRGLIEYNVVFFREGIQEICEVEKETRSGG